jgi:hypothetical protein
MIAHFALSLVCAVIRTEQETDLLTNLICKWRVLAVNAAVKCCASYLLKTVLKQIATCFVRRKQSTRYVYTALWWLGRIHGSQIFFRLLLSSQAQSGLWHRATLCAFLCSNNFWTDSVMRALLAVCLILVSNSLRWFFDRETSGDIFFRKVRLLFPELIRIILQSVCGKKHLDTSGTA